jgi:hypothetical protein
MSEIIILSQKYCQELATGLFVVTIFQNTDKLIKLGCFSIFGGY